MSLNRTKMAQSLHAFHSIALPVAPILPSRLPGLASRPDGQGLPDIGGSSSSAPPGSTAGVESEAGDRSVGVTHAAHDEMG